MSENVASADELRALAFSKDAADWAQLYELCQDFSCAKALLDALGHGDMKPTNPTLLVTWHHALEEMHPGISKS
ncbi:MAG TPA: hypothetical protein VET48_14785 [Steroidobacteraceae bacterium]|nr:hypothetical protein [Steroidobacteraceae bacterium]